MRHLPHGALADGRGPSNFRQLSDDADGASIGAAARDPPIAIRQQFSLPTKVRDYFSNLLLPGIAARLNSMRQCPYSLTID
ncbi:hypothetical protein [Methylobacterium marchantiae]|uniref:hypothetical protein n=1 Tax=Methylobacterium marchantiae TaxID=600331 RepID=UPI00366C1F7F